MKIVIRLYKIFVPNHFRLLKSNGETFTDFEIRLLNSFNLNFKKFIFLKKMYKEREIDLVSFLSLLKGFFCTIGKNFVV